MAQRPYFKADKKEVLEDEISFEFHNGFASIQKEKSRNSMHLKLKEKYPNAKILEVSTKSDKEIGKKLSAFNLKLDNRPFECIFQEAKCFKMKGLIKNTEDIIDRLEFSEDKYVWEKAEVNEAKELENFIENKYGKDDYYIKILPKDNGSNPRELRAVLRAFMQANKNITLSHFYYKGEEFELHTNSKFKSFFYDFLYFRALRENLNEDEIKEFLTFELFTDIEFNPKKSINCQARSCALYRFAFLNGKVDFYHKNRENFKSLYKDAYRQSSSKNESSPKESLFDEDEIKP